MPSIVSMVLSATICSSQLVAAPVGNQTCFVNQFKAYNSLIQKVSTFPEDNRTIMEKEFKKFGIEKDDVSNIRSNLSYVACPGTTSKNPGYSTAIYAEDSKTIVANLHAFKDLETGLYREPLSECTISTQAEISAHIPGRKLIFKAGLKSFEQAKAAGLLMHGDDPVGDSGDDWIVLTAKTSPKNVVPFKLPDVESKLHKCKVSQPQDCLKIVSVASHDEDMNGQRSFGGDSIVQSANLYNLRPADNVHPSRIYSNLSTQDGESGAINFLAGEDGVPLRKDGALIPFAITEGGAGNDKNGMAYNGGANIGSFSVGLDGPLADAIRKMSRDRNRKY